MLKAINFVENTVLCLLRNLIRQTLERDLERDWTT